MKRSLLILPLFIATFGLTGLSFAPLASAQIEEVVVTPINSEVELIDANDDGSVGYQALGDPSETFGPVLGFIMTLFATLMGWGGVLLNYAVYYTVYTMGNYVNDLAAVGVVWSIMRDIGNIILIFGFLAIGITTILNVNWYGGGTKMLPMLLIAAVFLNFSLFFAEAIVDVSNVLATQVYAQISGGQLPTQEQLASGGLAGISNIIVQSLGLATIYNIEIPGVAGGSDWLTNGTVWVVGFLGIFLFLIAAFVMFSLAFMLIARFVILVLLIIVSPIGFAGLAIPKLSGIAQRWWSMLFQQSLTAPVLLLLLYIALAVITDINFLGGFDADSSGYNKLASTQTPDVIAGFAGILLSFFVAMGLLMACVIVAKSMSAFGANWATKWGGRLSFGVVGFAGRNTIGMASQGLSRKIRSSKLGRVPFVGRGVANVLDRGAKASFDVRGTGVLKTFGSVDAGAAQKGGYRKVEEDRIKAGEVYGKSLRMTPKEEREQKEEKRREQLTSIVPEIKKQNEEEMIDLLTRHKAELKPFIDEVDAERKAVENAEKKYAASKTSANKNSLDAAKLGFNSALLDQQTKSEEQKKEQEELKRMHNKLIGVQEEEVEAHKKNAEEIGKRPGLTYAKRIAPTWLGEWGNKNLNYSNQEAARRIIDHLKKTKSERDNAAVIDALKGAADKLGSSGGSSK